MIHRSSVARVALLPCALVLTTPALSQRVLYTFNGPAPGEQLGAAVAGVGDTDKDGFPDVLIGVPEAAPNGVSSGEARLRSGRTGALLFTLEGDAAGDRFGAAVAAAGDVDADSYADFAVAAPGADSNGSDAGRVRIFSGRTGAVLYTYDGDSADDAFGTGVGYAGDVNGDTIGDLIVGAPGNDTNGADAGLAQVHSGATGVVLYRFLGDAPGDAFGTSVSGVGDADDDGFDDVAIGAPGDDDAATDAGSARVICGRNGNLMFEREGLDDGAALGTSVAGAGDVNDDGFDDVIAGAPGADIAGPETGRARVFSGETGQQLHLLTGDDAGDRFGAAVSGAGDVDGDGHGDFLVGAPLDDDGGDDSGGVRLFWGQFAAPIYTVYGNTPGDHYGAAVAGTGDIDADGRDDYVIGAPLDDPGGADSGRARVYAGQGRIGVNYCGPAPQNSAGLAGAVVALGSSLVADNDLTLKAIDLPAQKFGYFLASQNAGFFPGVGGSQGNLCLGGTIGRFVKEVAGSGLAGTFTIDVDLTSMPPPVQQAVLPGETWRFQAWYRDSNPTPTSNFTDAVAVDFQ